MVCIVLKEIVIYEEEEIFLIKVDMSFFLVNLLFMEIFVYSIVFIFLVIFVVN